MEKQLKIYLQPGKIEMEDALSPYHDANPFKFKSREGNANVYYVKSPFLLNPIYLTSLTTPPKGSFHPQIQEVLRFVPNSLMLYQDEFTPRKVEALGAVFPFLNQFPNYMSIKSEDQPEVLFAFNGGFKPQDKDIVDLFTSAGKATGEAVVAVRRAFEDFVRVLEK